MGGKRLALSVLPDQLGVCRLGPDDAFPDWVFDSPFFSITRTPEELSVVCIEGIIPPGCRCEMAWRCLKVRGPLAFNQTGVLAALTVPLAKAGISVFSLSTYDTDYLLVKDHDLDKAIMVLYAQGHIVK